MPPLVPIIVCIQEDGHKVIFVLVEFENKKNQYIHEEPRNKEGINCYPEDCLPQFTPYYKKLFTALIIPLDNYLIVLLCDPWS